MTVAVGLAGTGDWALAGLGPALRALPGVSITACASPDLEQARQFAAALAVPRVYPGLDEMLAAEPDLGLLVVSTPDDHHPAAIRSSAAAGVAVYCEKPLAASAGAAADLAAVVDSAGIPATIGFAFRYAGAVQRLRSDLRAGVLGTPWLLELYEHNAQFHPATGRALTWKGDPRHAGGGALFEYGAHVVDLGCWLLGPVADVTASFATVIPAAALDDIAAVQVRYASGALGTVLASWVLPGGFPGIRVRLHGSAGTGEAVLGSAGDGSERYLRWSPRGEVVVDLDLTPADTSHGVYAGRQLRDFVALADGRPAGHPDTMPTIGEALHVQHVLDTALRATAQRLPVPAPVAASGGPLYDVGYAAESLPAGFGATGKVPLRPGP